MGMFLIYVRTAYKEAEFVLLPLPLAQLKPLWAVGFMLVKCD